MNDDHGHDRDEVRDDGHECHAHCFHPPVEWLYEHVNEEWLEQHAEYPPNMIGVNMRAAVVTEDGVTEIPYFSIVMLREPKLADGSVDEDPVAWLAAMRPYMIPMHQAVMLARNILEAAIKMQHPAVFETGGL